MIGLVFLYIALMISWEDPSIGCYKPNNLDPYCNFAGYVDRAVFTEAHIMQKTDPEGIISTINAAMTTYVGYCFGLMILAFKGKQEKLIKYWLIFGLFCLIPIPLLTLDAFQQKTLYNHILVWCSCDQYDSVDSLFTAHRLSTQTKPKKFESNTQGCSAFDLAWYEPLSNIYYSSIGFLDFNKLDKCWRPDSLLTLLRCLLFMDDSSYRHCCLWSILCTFLHSCCRNIVQEKAFPAPMIYI